MQYTTNLVSSQMDHTDSGKRIWNCFWFRQTDTLFSFRDNFAT